MRVATLASAYLAVVFFICPAESSELSDLLEAECDNDNCFGGYNSKPIAAKADGVSLLQRQRRMGVWPTASCRRIDSRTYKGDLGRILEPVIFTHVLSGSKPGISDAWKRQRIMQEFGNLSFSVGSLDHNGAGQYIPNLISEGRIRSPPTLADILAADQPGNLFADNELAAFLIPPSEWLPEHSRRLLHNDALSGVSLGAMGQWNEVHIHKHAMFMQMLGSKRWVLAPTDTFPDADRVMISEGARHLKELTKEDVCTPGLAQNVAIHSARWNLTKFGYACDAYEGEALYLPGMTRNGGWWHGTCDLAEWNAGFALIR